MDTQLHTELTMLWSHDMESLKLHSDSDSDSDLNTGQGVYTDGAQGAQIRATEQKRNS